MPIVFEIHAFLEKIAPPPLAEPWDNCGLLVGHGAEEVTRALVALDITPEIIREAEAEGAELIVSHHPVIFEAIASVTDREYTGERVLMLAERGIAAICMHTNLDAAEGGVNDCLAARLGLREVSGLPAGEGRAPAARRGRPADGMTAADFARRVSAALGCPRVGYFDAGRPVRDVGLCGGAGSAYLEDAARAGCDTFLSSEIKHSRLLEARQLGLNLIDATHYHTEKVVLGPLAERLRDAFPGVRFAVAGSECPPLEFI